MKEFFRLEHARAGEHYTGKLLPINEPPNAITLLDINIPSTLTLEPNIPNGTISGVTHEPGEFEIVVTYFRQGNTPREEHGIAKLLVVPNPKLMWKDIPTPPHAPYWVPDTKHSLIKCARLTAIAASKRGRSHAHAGSFRDDDFTILDNGTWLVAVVADGAGSAKYSRKGAQLVCEQTSHYLIDYLGHLNNQVDAVLANSTTDLEAIKNVFAPIIKNALQSALDAIHVEYQKVQDGSELREFSTTTLLAITRKIEDTLIAITYSVGDGAIALHNEHTCVSLLSCGDTGDYAGQTRFLGDKAVTLDEVISRTKVATATARSSLLLMSDGVSDPFFETDNELSQIASWDNLWGNLTDAKASSGEGADIRLLQWLDFWSKGNHDDRTIIIITQE